MSPRALLRALPAVSLVLSCAHPPRPPARPLARVRLLAINDFHGQLEPGATRDGRHGSGAAVLATSLRAARDERPEATLIVSAGDLIGNSPALSSVLQDEPTIAFVNALAGPACRHVDAAERLDLDALAGDPRCDVVAAPGNHELDEGVAELRRVTRGGDRGHGPSLETPWRGARFPFLAANVVYRRSGRPVFPAAVVREVGGVRVGVVGAVLREVPDNVDHGKVDDLDFLDIADSVNAAVRGLVARGVRAVVLVVHDGGVQEPYAGPTRDDAPPVTGAIVPLVARLDGEVDVVVTGHYHAFTNARLRNAAGRAVLVTQALAGGGAFARIDLGIDAESGDVVTASAEVVPVGATAERPELAPDPEVARIVAAARDKVAPLFGRAIATAAQPIARGQFHLDASDAGEWPLGNLVADAFRAAMKADVALVLEGALRADLPAGEITWGHLYAAMPFGDTLVRVTLTGRELAAVLEQQWMPEPRPAWRPEPYILQVSGLEVAWDGSRRQGERIVALAHDGAPLAMDGSYTVAMASALANGNDRFRVLVGLGRDRVTGPSDIDALETYLAGLPQPVVAPGLGRITRRK